MQYLVFNNVTTMYHTYLCSNVIEASVMYNGKW